MLATSRGILKRRLEGAFFPWQRRKSSPITLSHSTKIGRTIVWIFSDGSHRRITGDRLDRRELSVSPRQYRKLRREING